MIYWGRDESHCPIRSMFGGSGCAKSADTKPSGFEFKIPSTSTKWEYKTSSGTGWVLTATWNPVLDCVSLSHAPPKWGALVGLNFREVISSIVVPWPQKLLWIVAQHFRSAERSVRFWLNHCSVAKDLASEDGKIGYYCRLLTGPVPGIKPSLCKECAQLLHSLFGCNYSGKTFKTVVDIKAA